MASNWKPERRARQAALIQTWKPWQQATGPQTLEGKAIASKNAYKGGHWLMMRELTSMVNAEVKAGRDLIDAIARK
jgi:hypothetical protein